MTIRPNRQRTRFFWILAPASVGGACMHLLHHCRGRVYDVYLWDPEASKVNQGGFAARVSYFNLCTLPYWYSYHI